MRHFLFAAIAVLGIVASGPALTLEPALLAKCSHAGAGYADGCAAAPLTGQFRNPDFFKTARQSGQSQYRDASGTRSDHPPPWDVAGVDYPVGHYTPDAKLLDPIKNPPQGCSYSEPSHWLRCGAGATIQHYRFNGVGLYIDKGPLVINDNHFTLTGDNCLNYRGTGLVHFTTGNAPLTFTSNTIDFDGGCSIVARLFKQPADPGLATQSTGTASLTGNTLTYEIVAQGTVRVGQYIHCDGCTEPAKIMSGSGTTWVLNVAQPTLNSKTVITGPVETNASEAISGGGPITALYNANLGFGEFIGAGTLESIVAKYNYSEMLSYPGQHINFIINLPGAAGTISQYVQDFNTIFWNRFAAASTGTGTIDHFATSYAGASLGTVTTALGQSNNNVIISNLTPTGKGGKVTAALLRFLNQLGGITAMIDYSLSGGTMDVSSINKGGPLKVGDYILCGNCTAPVRIVSFGTGTGATGTYNVSNSANSVTEKNRSVYPYPGEIGTLNWNENYLDPTGANSAFLFDNGNVPVKTQNINGNINMLSGRICTPSSCP